MAEQHSWTQENLYLISHVLQVQPNQPNCHPSFRPTPMGTNNNKHSCQNTLPNHSYCHLPGPTRGSHRGPWVPWGHTPCQWTNHRLQEATRDTLPAPVAIIQNCHPSDRTHRPCSTPQTIPGRVVRRHFYPLPLPGKQVTLQSINIAKKVSKGFAPAIRQFDMVLSGYNKKTCSNK